jgi:hypothetical protein
MTYQSYIYASLHMYNNNMAVVDTVTLTLITSFAFYFDRDFLRGAPMPIHDLMSVLKRVPAIHHFTFELSNEISLQLLSAMLPFLLEFGAGIDCNSMQLVNLARMCWHNFLNCR